MAPWDIFSSMLAHDCCGLVGVRKASVLLRVHEFSIRYWPRKTETRTLKILLSPPAGSSLSLIVSHLGPGTPTIRYSAFWWVVILISSVYFTKKLLWWWVRTVLPMDIRICIWKAVGDCTTLAHGGGRFSTRACCFSSFRFRLTALGVNSLKSRAVYVHLDNCWLLLRCGCHDCTIGDISPVWSLLWFSGFTATCIEFSDKWFLISWHTLVAVTSFGTWYYLHSIILMVSIVCYFTLFC